MLFIRTCFLILGIALLPFVLASQTLNSIIPSIGDSTEYYSIESIKLEHDIWEMKGEGQIWDFSDLIKMQSFTKKYLTPEGHPGTQSFPEANAVEVNIGLDNIAIFYKIYHDSLVQLGYRTNNYTVKYDEPPTIIKQPLEYNQSFSSPISIKNVFTGRHSYVFDGKGTLHLPDRTYDNAYRVSYLDFYSAGTTNDTIKFVTFYENMGGAAIAMFVNTLSSPEGHWGVTFRNDITSSVPERNNNDFVYISKDKLYLNDADDIKSIEIYDLPGKLVDRYLYIDSNKIDVSHLERGIYIVKVEHSEGYFTYKLIND